MNFISSFQGIVYCLSQKDAEEVCTELQRNGNSQIEKSRIKLSYLTFSDLLGVKAGCYHAGLTAQSRSQVHERWLNNRVHVICATIAFGIIFSSEIELFRKKAVILYLRHGH